VHDVRPTADGRGLRLRVLGAGERVNLVGTAPGDVAATAVGDGRELAVVRGDGGRFDLEVDVGSTGWSTIEVRSG
jgi:hypothetical protein